MLKRVNADELATAPAAAPRLSRGDVPAGEPEAHRPANSRFRPPESGQFLRWRQTRLTNPVGQLTCSLSADGESDVGPRRLPVKSVTPADVSPVMRSQPISRDMVSPGSASSAWVLTAMG